MLCNLLLAFPHVLILVLGKKDKKKAQNSNK